MDEDRRFPNRKKKQDWDMSALDKPVEASPGGEQAEETELPVNVYRVVPPAKKTKEQELAEKAELYSHRASTEAAQQLPVAGVPIVLDDPVYHAPEPETQAKTTSDQGLKQGTQKSAPSRTWIYATIVIGIGILMGAIVASLTLFNGSPNGRYDLGSVDSSADGLKGHLFVEWDKQLKYRLAIEPSDPDRQAAFAMAVANSPHPLSVEIHLQDPQGFVLCSSEILLKYDPRNTVGLAPPDPIAQSAKPDVQSAAKPDVKDGKPVPHGAKTDAGAAPASQPPQAADFTQADAQEAAREKGKDIFKNQVGPDGRVTAINAQGMIPCTAKNYEKAVAWSFTPNFPAIAEQDQLLEPQKGIPVIGDHPTAETPAARKKAVAKPAQKVLTFSIEGDDSIVDFDTSRGMIETTSGKAFFIDKAGGSISDPRWQDYPVEIHYRCDQTAECILMHRGTGALHVRLRR